MPQPPRQPEPEHSEAGQSLALTRAILVTGGGFGTTIATILAAAGKWQVGDAAILWALGTLCLVAPMTMLIVAYLTRSRR